MALEERRRGSDDETTDVLVWTNDRVIKWITSIGLKVGLYYTVYITKVYCITMSIHFI